MLTNTDAVEAIRGHHAEMRAELRRRVLALVDAVRDGETHVGPMRALLAYLEGELLPHARAEESSLYPAGDAGRTALLVTAMRDEHRDLAERVRTLAKARDGSDAIAMASAILALFESHLAKENDRLIPALAADPVNDLGKLLEGMHEILGDASGAK